MNHEPAAAAPSRQMKTMSDQVAKASTVCDEAFQLYVKEAAETHRLLSALSGEGALPSRALLTEQQIRESSAQLTYVSARAVLMDALWLQWRNEIVDEAARRRQRSRRQPTEARAGNA